MRRRRKAAPGGLFELGKHLVDQRPEGQEAPPPDCAHLVEVMKRRGADRRELVEHLAGVSRANLHALHETHQ